MLRRSYDFIVADNFDTKMAIGLRSCFVETLRVNCSYLHDKSRTYAWKTIGRQPVTCVRRFAPAVPLGGDLLGQGITSRISLSSVER